MNTERLHAVAKKLVEDFSEIGLTTALKQLEQILNRLAQKQAHTSLEPDNKIKDICELLDTSTTNNFPPTWIEIVADIGGSAFLAINIKSELMLIAKRPAPLSVKLQEIKGMQERLQPYINSLSLLCKSMQTLGIMIEKMEAGECEVGIIVPRKAVENTLGNFAKELIQLNKILGVFSEITTDSRESFVIKTISSSELTVFLEIAAPVAAALSLAIERILAMYKNMLEIQKLQFELEKQKAPENIVQNMKEHSENLVGNKIEELVEELLTKYHESSNAARKNELKIELRSALKKLAKRIDEGYQLEIRIEPYIGNEDHNDAHQQIEQILNSTRKIEYPELSSNKVLNLPDIED